MRRRFAALVVVSIWCAPSCAGPDERAAEPPGAEAYATVIAPFLPRPVLPDERAVVYVVPVNGEALALDTQVAVIDALAEEADVRFVDDVRVAVDEDSSGQPPRDDGVLVGLGRFSTEAPYTVRVELYRRHDRVEARLLTVRQRGDDWVISGSETVTPEVLTGDG